MRAMMIGWNCEHGPAVPEEPFVLLRAMRVNPSRRAIPLRPTVR